MLSGFTRDDFRQLADSDSRSASSANLLSENMASNLEVAHARSTTGKMAEVPVSGFMAALVFVIISRALEEDRRGVLFYRFTC
jgi:hypothetical protein